MFLGGGVKERCFNSVKILIYVRRFFFYCYYLKIEFVIWVKVFVCKFVFLGLKYIFLCSLIFFVGEEKVKK